MSSQMMSRVYELIDLIEDRSDSSAYFQNFDDSVRYEPFKAEVWLAREREFQRLDSESWNFLKSELRPYLTSRHASRGWQQLISILNQAYAYNYLLDEGCSSIKFIPRASGNGIKTPDLSGILNGKQVLCEVKTINISEVESNRRNNGGILSSTDSLTSGFFTKLKFDLDQAKKQMESYDDSVDGRHIVFILINFDDFLAEYKKNYFMQIDQQLAKRFIHNLDIVFYNQKTPFHFPVTMLNAIVINESD